MKTSQLGLIRQYAAASTVGISVIISGTFLGWPSPVLIMLEEMGQPMRLTSAEISWMVSLLYIGNFASPLPSGIMMDKIGRRKSLLILSIIPVTSWLLILYATNPFMLYVSRFLAGAWNGTVSTIATMYLAEISEPKIRGALSTFVQLMTNFGVMFEYIVGPYVSYNVLALISGSVPLLFVSIFWFMPESPYWLLIQNCKEEAIKSLAWLRGDADTVKEEIDAMEFTVQEEMRNRGTFKDLIATKGNCRALVIVEMLAILQRMSGVSAIIAFSSTTLPNAGKLNPNDCVIIMGIVSLVCVFIATGLVDSLGRKPLLLFSSTGCGIAMFVAGLWYFFNEKTLIDVSNYYWVPFAAFITYNICFASGLGPIPTTVQGELFPTNTKGIASGLTSFILAITSFIMNKIYHPIAEGVGMYLNYWIFSGACVVSVVFVVTYVIETKGKTLFEIQENLNNTTSKKKSEDV